MKIAKLYLKALEEDQNGNWDAAHKIVQEYADVHACWIHAYLHRKEGDLGNAGYWYRRAKKEMPDLSLDEEWQVIYDDVSKLLGS